MKHILVLLALFALFAGSLGLQVEKWTMYTDSSCTNPSGQIMYFYRPYGALPASPSCVQDSHLGWLIVSREADDYYPPKTQYIVQSYIYLGSNCVAGNLQSIEIHTAPVSASTCDNYHNSENTCFPNNDGSVSLKTTCNPSSSQPTPPPQCDNSGPTNVCGSANEQEWLSLGCPPGKVIRGVSYANYGHPYVNPPCDQSWTDDSCSLDVRSQIFNACNGKNVCYYYVDPNQLSNPCYGQYKNLAVIAQCWPANPCSYI